MPRHWAPGSSVTLEQWPQTAPAGELQWLHDDKPIPGATGLTLTLTNLSSSDSGNYRLRLTSGNAITFSDDTVTINVFPRPPSPVDPTFTSALTTRVSAIGPFAADGSMIIRTYDNNGYQALRLSHDGNFFPGFNYPTNAGIVLAGFADGQLLVANAPYHLNANGRAAPLVLPSTFDPAQPLSAAAVQSDGKFYLAQGRNLARYLSDGTIDPSFTFADSTETVISGLQLDRNNRLYIHGQRTDSNPSNWPHTWTNVYRVTDTGARDSRFAIQTGGDGYQVTLLEDGRILYYSYYAAHHSSGGWKILRDDGSPDPAWTGSAEYTEQPILVNPATSQLYLINAAYQLLRYNIGTTHLSKDESFFAGTTVFHNSQLELDLDGQLLVSGEFSDWEGHPTNNLARIRPNAIAGVLPPSVEISSSDSTPPQGSTLTFGSTVTGTGPFSYQWLGLDGQSLPADTTSPQLTIPNVTAAHLGRYQLRVTGPGGLSVLSDVISAKLDSEASYLTNLSGRALTGTGEDTVIAGLTTQTTNEAFSVSTLLRAAGPALKSFGVANFLPNPALDLFNAAGSIITNNDEWSVNPDVAAAAAAAGAFSFELDSHDAALLHTFPTGQATVVLKNQGDGAGIGLLEIYQLFPLRGDYRIQLLTNLSFRARTSPGEGTAIAGFVIVDPQGFDRPAKVLLRAIGPTLGSYGIQHPLTNPILTVYNSKGEVVATNDDWAVNNSSADPATLTDAMKQVGAFALTSDSKDSALLLNLPAGAYSMQATGGSGVVLLEVYLVR